MTKANQTVRPLILLALFVLYLIVLFQITIFRGSSSEFRNMSLVPFYTISEYLQSIQSGNRIIGITNLLGNLVLLFPLGYLAALLFPNMRKAARIWMLAFASSAVIEAIQYVFACGRADIDDVILNTLGGVFGYWAYCLTTRSFRPKKYAVAISASMIALTCIGFFAVNNDQFLVRPPVPGNRPEYAKTLDGDFEGPLALDEQPDALPSADEAVWYFILVNKWNAIPEDYEVELTQLQNGQSVDSRIYPALQDMFDAARSDGVYPVVASGYRTAEKQQSLMDQKIADYRAEGYSTEEATAKAEAWVAIPGTSEHQLGIAVDINADGIHSTGGDVYEWLNENAYRFGFICRYPSDKTEMTGVISEPWHYRYVGIEAAAEMQNSGVCLEEYLTDGHVVGAQPRAVEPRN